MTLSHTHCDDPSNLSASVRRRMDTSPLAAPPGAGLLARRKNRNKKGLALGSEAAKPGTLSGHSAADLLAAPASVAGLATPPVPSRPPPIQVAGSSRSNRASLIETSGLSIGAESPLLPTTPSLSTSSSSSFRSRGLSDRLADLELGVEFKLDLRNEDLHVISELGCGNGGTVSKALHVPTKVVMAKKVSDQSPRGASVRGELTTETRGVRSFTLRLRRILGNKS